MGNTHTYRYIKVPSKPAPGRIQEISSISVYGGYDGGGEAAIALTTAYKGSVTITASYTNSEHYISIANSTKGTSISTQTASNPITLSFDSGDSLAIVCVCIQAGSVTAGAIVWS